MRIVIAGGHGKIALLLSSQLATLGHHPVGLIRNAAHAADVRATGAEPVVLDLEGSDVPTLALALAGADAVVFAAGAGPGSSAERKLTVDRDGAILLADAAVAAGIRRIVVISAIGADGFDPASADVFQVYLRAKSEADAAVRALDLDWTIVRPGGLTDDEPTGLVTLAESVARGSIPRTDVAAIVTRLVLDNSAVRRQFEVTSGGTPIAAALGSL
jgi:uncharacterized protein YbjT (DUF2867 family)